MASIQLVKLQPKIADSTPTSKRSPERFWRLAKVAYQSTWLAYTLEDTNTATHRLEETMKYNVFVENME